jgi:hypothetical protein
VVHVRHHPRIYLENLANTMKMLRTADPPACWDLPITSRTVSHATATFRGLAFLLKKSLWALPIASVQGLLDVSEARSAAVVHSNKYS